MLTPSFLRALFVPRGWRKRPLPRHPYRPVLEVLEDRLPPGNLLSTTAAFPNVLSSPLTAPVQGTSGAQPTTSADATPSSTTSTSPSLTPAAPAPTSSASPAATPVNIQPAAAPQPSNPLTDPISVTTVAALTTTTTLTTLPPTQPAQGGAGVGAGTALPTAPSAGGGASSVSAGSSGAPVASAPGFALITGISKDTGFSNHDFVTNDTMAQVLGMGTPGASLTLQVDGKGVATGTIAADGNFAIGVPSPLSEGTHQLAVQPAGASAPTSSVNVTIDTTPPTISLAAPDFTTNRPLPQLTVTIDPTNFDGPPVFSIDVDLQHDGNFTDPGDSNYYQGPITGATTTFTLPTPLAEGTYQLRARTSDLAGNVGVSPTVTMQVDPNAGFLGQQNLVKLGEVAQGLSPMWSSDTLGYGPQGFIPKSETFTYSVPSGSGGTTLPSGSGQQQLPPPGSSQLPPAPTPPTPQQQFPEFSYNDKGDILVSVRATLGKYVSGLENDLENLGMQVVGVFPDQNMVQGYLPIKQILNLPTLANFSTATGVPREIKRMTPTQGGPDLLQPQYIAATGADGSGVKIGVISDSVSQVGGGISDSIASGDLPSSGVQVLLDDTGDPFATDEGRAMLEIDHHIAPGASLAFSAAVSPQVMASGIANLNSVGAKVIEDDVGFLDSPFFNDGIIAQAADAAVAKGSFYASAAGNNANQGWQGAWTSLSTTVAGTKGTYEDFGGGNALQQFTLPVGGFIDIIVQWDAAFLEGGSPQANFQVPNEIDALVTDSKGNALSPAQTFNTNTLNTDEAFQEITFSNDGSFGTNNFAFAFQLAQGSAPTQLRWISFADDPMAAGEGAPTTFGQPAAKSAVAVGAVNWATPTVPEPYTSVGGPLTFLFDQNGNRLAAPEIRNKPDVTGPDDVDTSFFGTDDEGDGLPNFAGTSAATPHVGAAAALLMSQAPSVATPAFVTKYLEKTALDIGAPGYDNLTGFGLVQLKPLNIFNEPPDAFEPNDTSDKATQFGVLTDMVTYNGLTIATHPNGLPDYDWYRWSAGATGTFTVNVDVTQGGDLELHLWTLQGNTLVELGSTTQSNGSPSTLSLSTPVVAGQPILVEIKGRNSSPGVQDQGAYDLTAQIA